MRPLTALRALVILTLLLAFAAPAWADGKTHLVQPGETLYRISLQHGVSVEALRAANSLRGNLIYAGQTLVIPDPNASAAPPAAPQTGGAYYTVQRGDTLHKIGLRYGLQWTVIQAANGLSSTRIYAGQRLYIPASGSAPAAQAAPEPAAQAAPQSSSAAYIVQRGDTLFTIGLKYNLSWTAIQAANNLGGTKIYAGQQLVIPTGGSAAQPAPAAPAGDGKRFVVDLSEQRLYAYEDDTLVRTTLISSGIARYPTVTGTFAIYLRYTSARMRGPGYDLPNVPYVMYFYKSYGLHGTYWHNNFGTPMSHGCVNMPTSEAEWAFNWSDYGTPVIVQP